MANAIDPNSNIFSIWNYINSNLEEENLNDKIIVCLNTDSNNEPYIEITYVNSDGVEAGLTKNYNYLNIMADFLSMISNVFESPLDEDIVSIIYSFNSDHFYLVENKNNQYLGNHFYDEDDDLFVGYIVRKNSAFTFESKIEKLYTVMQQIMKNSDEYSADSFVFKVKDKTLQNIYFTKDWNKGYIENEYPENIDKENIRIISDEYMIKLDEKIKKL